MRELPEGAVDLGVEAWHATKDGALLDEQVQHILLASAPKIEAAVEERVREGLKAARRDTDGVPFLDAARALCPDEAHWEGEGWRRYADDASACIDAFLSAALDSCAERPQCDGCEQAKPGLASVGEEVLCIDCVIHRSKSRVEELERELGEVGKWLASENGPAAVIQSIEATMRGDSYTEQGGGEERFTFEEIRERLKSPEVVEAACRATVADWRPDYTEHTPEGEAVWGEVEDALLTAFDAAFPQPNQEETEPSEQRFERINQGLEQLIETEVEGVVEQRDACEASLARIRAAAESDADLAKLPALRDFLLAETKTAISTTVIGHMPEETEADGGER